MAELIRGTRIALAGLEKSVSYSFEPRPNDVIIVGPMKSGTTWMQQILHQIRMHGDEKFEDIYDMVPLIPARAPPGFHVNVDQVAEPRIFKIHASYQDAPKLDSTVKYVIPIRHPYDSEFSYVKWAWRWVGVDKDVTKEEYIQFTQLQEKGQKVPTIVDFIASWWPHRKDPNVMFIPYEDLKADLPLCIQKLAIFIHGKPLEEPALSKVSHYCSYEYMSKNTHKFDNPKQIQLLTKLAQVEPLPVLANKVRVGGGQIGQGKASLHPSIRQYLDESWARKIEAVFGFKNYEDMYDSCTHVRKEE